MLHKSHEIKEFTAATNELGDITGEFEAVVSVFGNVDKVGDRVMKGAFEKSLARWSMSGDPIPVIWSHQWSDPKSHLGIVVEAAEKGDGLWVKGQLDMDNEDAAYVGKLLAERRVKEFSFAYDVIEEARSKKDGANDLIELDIFEVGPTLKGANPSTQLIAAKGVVLSKKTESDLRQATALIAGVLAQTSEGEHVDATPIDEGQELKAQEPETATAEATPSEGQEPDTFKDDIAARIDVALAGTSLFKG